MPTTRLRRRRDYERVPVADTAAVRKAATTGGCGAAVVLVVVLALAGVAAGVVFGVLPFLSDKATVAECDGVNTALSTLTASPASAVADGEQFVSVLVTLLDDNQNPVPGVAVQLLALGHPCTIIPETGTTMSSSDGRVAFVVRSTVAGYSTLVAQLSCS